MIYSFFNFGHFVGLVRFLQYPVIRNIDIIDQVIQYLTIIIWIVGFINCYKIVKDKSILIFAYTIIPLWTVLNIRYALFVVAPLVIINKIVISFFDFNPAYWNPITLQIIGLVTSIIIVVRLLEMIKSLFNEK